MRSLKIIPRRLTIAIVVVIGTSLGRSAAHRTNPPGQSQQPRQMIIDGRFSHDA